MVDFPFEEVFRSLINNNNKMRKSIVSCSYVPFVVVDAVTTVRCLIHTEDFTTLFTETIEYSISNAIKFKPELKDLFN